MPSRIYKGDKIERVTWDTINEFLEEQKSIERSAIIKGNKSKLILTEASEISESDPLTQAFKALDQRFDKWKTTLDNLLLLAKKHGKRVEDSGLKKIIPRALTGSAIVIRFFVTPKGEVQFQKTEIEFTLRNEKTGQRVL